MSGRTDEEISIRLADIGEAGTVARVLRLAFAEFEPLYSPAAFVATTPTADQLRARWAEGPTWVALHGGEVVGTIGAVAKTDGTYIRSTAVAPSQTGRGTGRQLLKEVEAFAAQRGSSRLYLSTTPFLERAIRLYTGCGFVRAQEGPHDLFGTPLFTMTKDIDPGPG